MREQKGPSSEINLTPLLDIIFIFLLIVTVGYVKQTTELREQKENELVQAQEEAALYKERLQALEQENYDEAVLKESYEESLREYAELNRMVRQISIYCTYDPYDYSRRTLRVLIPGQDIAPIEINPGNETDSFLRLEQLLRDDLRSLREAAPDAENGVTEGQSFVILSLSLKQIQRWDREQIDAVAQRMMEQFDDVYYRKFREPE